MAMHGIQDSLRSGYPTFDKSAWSDYNIVLFVREPYERYISGLWTLWYIRWEGNTDWGSQGAPHNEWSNFDKRELVDFNKWYEDVLERTNVYHFLNGHLRPFLVSHLFRPCIELRCLMDHSYFASFLYCVH